MVGYLNSSQIILKGHVLILAGMGPGEGSVSIT